MTQSECAGNCTARHRDAGEPYQCNVCRFWFSEEAFPTKHRRNESTCYRVCSACEVQKPCHRCKVKKPVTEYTASAWKARNMERRICKACMQKGKWDLRHLSPIPRAYGLQRMAAPPTVRSRRNPDLRRMLPRKEIDMYHRKGARTPPETQNNDTPPRDFAGGSSGGRKPSARSKNWGYWYGKGAEPKHDTVPAQP